MLRKLNINGERYSFTNDDLAGMNGLLIAVLLSLIALNNGEVNYVLDVFGIAVKDSEGKEVKRTS